MAAIHITLFGAPRIARDGAAVALERRRKALALLAYLAVTRQSHSREALATLLWPEVDAERGRGSLRQALADLNVSLGKGWIETEGDQVALADAPGLRMDVGRFRELLAGVAAHSHPPHRPCDACLADLTEAANLYTADFLAGFTLADAAEFDAWQSFQTESLRLELAGGLEKLAHGLAGRQEYEPAIRHARRWLALDPLHEPAHRLLMQLHAGAGDRVAALRQYGECVKVLRAELGIEPEPETTALCEALRGGTAGQPALASSPSPAPTPTHNLPADPTPFIGRTVELAQIAARLADPACRLLTILGPGGIGKTRLAIQAGLAQVARFADGVWFVDLAPLPAAEAVAPTALRALNVTAPSIEPDQQLREALRNRHSLLLLDNFEHLTAAAGLLADWLSGAPRLKLLITSRARLGLRQEWLLPLAGLDLPMQADGRGAVEEPNAALTVEAARPADPDLARYGATALFVDCVRRIRPDFRANAEEAAAILRICRLLEGMPLGIELAAAWARTLTLGEIADEIGRGLGILATSMRDAPVRQRSMQASLDHSWRLISPRERSVLRALSVFRGGFTRQAAEVVVGATLADLSGLLDASWLRRASSGRYEMHELVREYGAEKLEDEPALANGKPAEDATLQDREVQGRHAAYYASLFQALDRAISQQSDAAKAITADLGNAQAAWHWAIAAGKAEIVRRTGEALQNSEALGWLPNALPNLDTAIAQLKARDDLARRPDLVTLLAYILALKGERLMRLGLYQDAHPCLDEGLELMGGVDKDEKMAEDVWFWLRYRLAELLHYQGQFVASIGLFEAQLAYLEGRGGAGHGLRLDDVEIWFRQAQHYHFLMMNVWGLGRYAEAQAYEERNLALAGKVGEFPRAHALRWLGVPLHASGAYGRGQQVLGEALRILQSFGDLANTALASHTLGLIEAATGRHAQAQVLFRRSLGIAEELGWAKVRVQALNGLAAVALVLGQAGEAQRLYEESVALFNRPGSGRGLYLASAVAGLGQVALVSHEVGRAKGYFRQALSAIGCAAWETAQAVTGMAMAIRQEGNLAYAVELLAFVEDWPAAWFETRQEAGKLRQELEVQLSPEVFAAAIARGHARQVAAVVAELVAQQN